MYRLTELRRLAQAYLDATGDTPIALSFKIVGRSNAYLIGRLINGRGISSPSFEAATAFFDQHWPPGVGWPAGIERNRASGNPHDQIIRQIEARRNANRKEIAE